jgi:hypothetical protein
MSGKNWWSLKGRGREWRRILVVGKIEWKGGVEQHARKARVVKRLYNRLWKFCMGASQTRACGVRERFSLKSVEL